MRSSNSSLSAPTQTVEVGYQVYFDEPTTTYLTFTPLTDEAEPFTVNGSDVSCAGNDCRHSHGVAQLCEAIEELSRNILSEHIIGKDNDVGGHGVIYFDISEKDIVVAHTYYHAATMLHWVHV